MEKDFRERNRKGYVQMRMVYDYCVALLILGMSVVMFAGDRLNIEFVNGLDPLMRYLFGGLCLLYGGFRLYRGIKKDY